MVDLHNKQLIEAAELYRPIWPVALSPIRYLQHRHNQIFDRTDTIETRKYFYGSIAEPDLEYKEGKSIYQNRGTKCKHTGWK